MSFQQTAYGQNFRYRPYQPQNNPFVLGTALPHNASFGDVTIENLTITNSITGPFSFTGGSVTGPTGAGFTTISNWGTDRIVISTSANSGQAYSNFTYDGSLLSVPNMTGGTGTFGELQVTKSGDSQIFSVNQNVNSQAQVALTNSNSGISASQSLVVDNNIGDFVKVGINSSNFSNGGSTLFGMTGSAFVNSTADLVIGGDNLYFTYATGTKALQINNSGAVGLGKTRRGFW